MAGVHTLGRALAVDGRDQDDFARKMREVAEKAEDVEHHEGLMAMADGRRGDGEPPSRVVGSRFVESCRELSWLSAAGERQLRKHVSTATRRRRRNT